ncbi:superoxide dismutase [Cu-Zn]-like [Elaeis guineensis]|uniref:Superoxide dismutase [Cu-Zn]-like n=1 Tax=Elaeis guineensis var. tenera TaxID=51953 RepID=A0A6J0PJZ2_ELAGV|nr:superoxide dismutase [Cu-Zn]-like [Elaeis guineensis]
MRSSGPGHKGTGGAKPREGYMTQRRDEVYWTWTKQYTICTNRGANKSSLGFSWSSTSPKCVQGLHGFYVHAFGDTTNSCMSTGPHSNLTKNEHGALENENCHVGDLENVTAGEDETVNFSTNDKRILLSRPNFIIGRAIVVHADLDDLEKDKLYSSDIYVNFMFH